jgi:hypothetical protein
MSEEELVFQLLEEEMEARVKRIVEEKRITTEDCLVLGVLRLNVGIKGLHEKIDELRKDTTEKIDDTNKRIDDTTEKIEAVKESLGKKIEAVKESLGKKIDSNFRWTIALILGMWVTMMAALIPLLLRLIRLI